MRNIRTNKLQTYKKQQLPLLDLKQGSLAVDAAGPCPPLILPEYREIREEEAAQKAGGAVRLLTMVKSSYSSDGLNLPFL